MNIADALELLRELRRNPASENFWNDFSLLMRSLAGAETCLLVDPNGYQDARILGADPAAADWLVQKAHELLASNQSRLEGLGGAASLQCSDLKARLRLLVAARVSAKPSLIAVLDIPARERSRLTELLLRIQLVADLSKREPVPTALPATMNENPAIMRKGHGELIDALELVADVMGEASFGAAVLILVNGLAARLGSSQVTLGWFDGGYIRVEAISHVSRFDVKTEHARLLESACEEAFDQERPLVYPSDDDTGRLLIAHRQLYQSLGPVRIHSLPLRSGEQPCQAVLLIVEQDVPVSKTKLEAIQVGLGLLMPWLSERRARDRWWGPRLFDWATERLGRLLGPEYPWQKVTALAVVGGLLYICLASWPFRLEAGAVMVTDRTRLIGAPFDGYVDQAYATTGDELAAGAPLAKLDVNDLLLQEAEIRARMRSLNADTDKARAQNNLADVEIAQARLAQSRAGLERVLHQRGQADIRAPFAGVIVEGERKDLLGAPVRKGDTLFRLAQIEGLYGQLELPERLIRFLNPEAKGELALLAQPDTRIPFQVTGIVPMAQIKNQQGNQFIVKVTFTQEPEKWWRPGMSGMARIEAGHRPIIWLWTYRLIDTLRMRLWW
ncbi:hypothetical protein DSCO28_34460 [Desulfosarcina ovata subsp. sediminis]|uniref:Uncharacterized protein n=1 Tax=Desulfosarcina ovata subsp. sediminis TaxID=885957 RepID=A0A5K7ZR74_9BACT|nr:HlyD family efflux transporter periplasmic adaptor subunit [Desulfosarcina ovata]BBO82880.1 hypothetical protein DSCO28_34460 [Desulfosarcina ovata subsp. sediminis]